MSYMEMRVPFDRKFGRISKKILIQMFAGQTFSQK
jgi:hypothetical protein